MDCQTKLTLESYFDYVSDPRSYRLTRYQINQIIFMHGLIKLYNIPKREFVENLRKIKLVSPVRSTLKEEVSCCRATGDVNEMKEDLLALGWNECTIRFVETLGLEKENVPVDDDRHVWSWGRNARKMTPKRKRKTSVSRELF